MKLGHAPFSTIFKIFLDSTRRGMWGRVRDVINHAKFHLDRFRGLEPQLAENRYLPLTGGIAVTTVYELTCYTCDAHKELHAFA